MIKFLGRLLLALLLAAALGYFLFPFVSDQALQYQNAALIREYRRAARSLPKSQVQETLSAARKYNAQLRVGSVRDMFSETVQPARTEEKNPLQIDGSEIVGQLEIPSIGVSLPVFPADSADALERGVMLASDAGLPAGGEGHVVIAGASGRKAEGMLGSAGLDSAFLLKDLGKVKEGDLLYLYVLDRTWVYQVTECETVPSSRFNSLDWHTAGERLTLLSNPGDQRLLVHAERLPDEEAEAALNAVEKTDSMPSWASVMIIGSPVLLLGLLMMFIVEIFKKHRYRLPLERKRSDHRKG